MKKIHKQMYMPKSSMINEMTRLFKEFNSNKDILTFRFKCKSYEITKDGKLFVTEDMKKKEIGVTEFCNCVDEFNKELQNRLADNL